MADENRCGHEMCNCPVTDDSEYCSEQCETAAEADITGIQCECDHPGCSMSV